jgi:large subunit ribosomal protein L18
MKKSCQSLYQKRKARVRGKIFGTPEKPRLSVYKSHTAIYAQLIDDTSSKTLVSASSIKTKKSLVEESPLVGKSLAEKAKEQKISRCVFDRNGYKYHGAVKLLADAAREGGLQF